MLPCPHCGSALLAGHLSEQARIQFLPEGAPFFTLTSNRVEVDAWMCQGCGRIELRGDVEKLRSVLGR